ncbi:MAG: DNA polymerase IV [Candidatus Tyloplasma litorale]|nr:MAG: DNA polymerase IV [Mycoplasmatales bacterium]
MDRLIFTIDLDAFFASCEEIKNPLLKNKPMVVSKQINGKGVVTTSNYQARNLGVKSGMPLFKAKKMVPNIFIVEPDYEFYQKKANQVFKIINNYSNILEIASIDECYVDLTRLAKKYSPILIAKKIKEQIFKETNLIVSIGISTNVILSKIASSLDKPNGITTIYKHEIPHKLWTLNINKLYMVGKSSSEILYKYNINKIRDLANLKLNNEKYNEVKNFIGINIDKHIEHANGIGRDKLLVKEVLVKSLSKDETFEFSIKDYKIFKEKVYEIFNKLFFRLNIRKLSCKTINVSIKLDKQLNKKGVSQTLKYHSNNKELLWNSVNELSDKIFKENFSIRYISISFSNLIERDKNFTQLNIDQMNKKTKIDRIEKIISEINEKFNIEIFTGEKMKDNRFFNKKKYVDNDKIKFKIWDK